MAFVVFVVKGLSENVTYHSCYFDYFVWLLKKKRGWRGHKWFGVEELMKQKRGIGEEEQESDRCEKLLKR